MPTNDLIEPWPVVLEKARKRAAQSQKRYKVWANKAHYLDGTVVWIYVYGPYATGTARSRFQMGCTSCGLVGQARIHCSNEYHSTPKAIREFVDMYGEEGEIEVAGAKTTVRIRPPES